MQYLLAAYFSYNSLSLLICLKKIANYSSLLREMIFFYDFYLLRIFLTKPFQTDITELYSRGKISYPTFFKGCWSKREILFKTLISEKKTQLTPAYAK